MKLHDAPSRHELSAAALVAQQGGHNAVAAFGFMLCKARPQWLYDVLDQWNLERRMSTARIPIAHDGPSSTMAVIDIMGRTGSDVRVPMLFPEKAHMPQAYAKLTEHLK